MHTLNVELNNCAIRVQRMGPMQLALLSEGSALSYPSVHSLCEGLSLISGLPLAVAKTGFHRSIVKMRQQRVG